VGFGNNGLAKANLHGANDQKVLAGGDRESVGAGFTDSGASYSYFIVSFMLKST
jgi:hypothetical protein